MGWLDNSTNNIMLDAVLTDYGRQALARNNGSFSVEKFALGDDEINYGIIKKYGRTVGREKIEKNTPVFEAFTNQNLALKYKLLSCPVPLLYLPKLTLETSQTVAFSTSAQTPQTQNIVITEKPQGTETVIDSTIKDVQFDVFVPDLFLSISSQLGSAPDVNKISKYNLTSIIQNNNPQLQFTLALKPISQTLFSVYGKNVSNVLVISTSVRVVGVSSGLSLDIPVTITNTY